MLEFIACLLLFLENVSSPAYPPAPAPAVGSSGSVLSQSVATQDAGRRAQDAGLSVVRKQLRRHDHQI